MNNRQKIESILKDNFQDNFRIEVDYTITKEEMIKIHWFDGTPAGVVENVLQNKINDTRFFDTRYLFLFRYFSNAYILEKFEILTKEFKFLNNTLKKLKKEHENGIIFSKNFESCYCSVNRTIKNKFQYCSLFKDKNPQSVACLINFYFQY